MSLLVVFILNFYYNTLVYIKQQYVEKQDR